MNKRLKYFVRYLLTIKISVKNENEWKHFLEESKYSMYVCRADCELIKGK